MSRPYADRSEFGGRARGDGERGGSTRGKARTWASADSGGRAADSRGRHGSRSGFGRGGDRPSRDPRAAADRFQDRDLREEGVYPPGLEPRENEPETPRDVDLRDLPRPVRAEMRTLSDKHAEIVGAHVMAAIELGEEDPELAHRHALAARRRAPRLPIIRELTAETAYAAGEWAQALSEYRAVRRMTGNDEVLPTMADCERALGHPEEALRFAREATRADLSKEQRVEMRIVEAGARDDMGQHAEARRLLKSGVDEFIDAPALSQARLRAALAEHLLARGKQEQAISWLRTAAQLDPDGSSGAQDRLDELSGAGVDGGFDVLLDQPDEESVAQAALVDAEHADRLPHRTRDAGLADGPVPDQDVLDIELDPDEPEN